jgi:hypothetical protein
VTDQSHEGPKNDNFDDHGRSAVAASRQAVMSAPRPTGETCSQHTHLNESDGARHMNVLPRGPRKP